MQPPQEHPEPAGDTHDPYAQKVLRAFVKQGRLTGIPAQRRKRDVILDVLLRDFEPDREYPEAEVNRILGAWHEDFFTLRREMIVTGRMTRERGVYRRPAREARTAGPLDDLPVRSRPPS